MLTDDEKAWMDEQIGLDQSNIEGNLAQDTTPERRSQAIRLARDNGVPVDMAERNLDRLSDEDKAWMDNVSAQPPEVTRAALEDPELGPAIKDDVESFNFTERMLLDTIQRFRKGLGVARMGEIGTAMMNGTATTQQLSDLETIRAELESPYMQTDYGFENPVLDVGMFISGAVAENVPIMGHMLWEAKEEAVTGAIAGTLMGAAASAPTAGAGAVVTAPGGAAIGLGVGLKVGMSKAAFELEAGNAYLEYIAMKDKNGNAMDPNVAKGAAITVGLANAALELVAFERLARTVPGMDKVMGKFSREGMRKLMGNSTARSALARFGGNVASVSAVEGITEMAQETLTILGGVAAGELEPGEYDHISIVDALKQVGHAGLQGAAGGGGISVPTAGATALLEFRREQAANANLEKLVKLGEMAKDSAVAERLPEDFRNHLLRVRDVHGDGTQTLVPLATLQAFFQQAEMSEADVQARMPELWTAMEEAELTGVEVNIPFEELGAELARMDTFDALAPDIRITAEGITARESEQLATDREAVYEEFAELAGREEAHEGSANRVTDDVRTMLEEAGVAPSVAEQQSILHGEFWKRVGERFGRDPFEMYTAYAGLSVGRIKAQVLEGQGFDRSDAIIGRLREGRYPTQQEMFGASLTEWLRANGGLLDEGGELAARDATSLMRNGQHAMTFEEAHQRLIEAGYMSEESWTDKSQGDLLELIDQDLHNGGVYRLGGGDTRMQDTAQEMGELEELLDRMGVDFQTMTNEEVRAAIREASYFQGLGKHLDEGDYEALDAESTAAVDKAIAESEEPARVKAALLLHKNTAWAFQAIAGAKARIAVRHLIAGEKVPFKSVFDHPKVQGTRVALEKGGMAAVEQLLVSRTMIGHAGKPVNAVNGSFLDCEPSVNCAKYCYATGSNYKYAANVIKGELIAMFINENPVRAAEIISSQYSPMQPDPRPGRPAAYKALRLFDKGDGNMQWIPVIKELNQRGISVQIFSKRPEFLRAVPEQNWRMLSIDQTNYAMAEENPDLDIAMVYEGTDEEITWLNAHKERVAVILPIMGGRVGC